jgi:hypothetical protein
MSLGFYTRAKSTAEAFAQGGGYIPKFSFCTFQLIPLKTENNFTVFELLNVNKMARPYVEVEL